MQRRINVLETKARPADGALPQVSYFLEVKELKEDGTFTGTASAYGVEDMTNDVIDKGAFTKTLSENPTVPVLWQHDRTEVIGSGEVKESGNKILIVGQLDLEDPMGQKAYGKMKRKLVKGLSIGFQTIKAKWEELEQEGRTKYIRHIQELKLWEVSVVTFPALPQAQVTGVKSADETDARFARLEEQIQALQATKGTPATEPPPAAEPPKQQPVEPEVHSLLSSMTKNAKEI